MENDINIVIKRCKKCNPVIKKNRGTEDVIDIKGN
jgi:hypothetical protein